MTRSDWKKYFQEDFQQEVMRLPARYPVHPDCLACEHCHVPKERRVYFEDIYASAANLDQNLRFCWYATSLISHCLFAYFKKIQFTNEMLNKLPLAVYPIGMGCVSGMSAVALLPSEIDQNDWCEFAGFVKFVLLPEILVGEAMDYHLFVEKLKRGVGNELVELQKKRWDKELQVQIRMQSELIDSL